MREIRIPKPLPHPPTDQELGRMAIAARVLGEYGYKPFDMLPEAQRHPTEYVWVKGSAVVRPALIARFVPSGRIIIRHFMHETAYTGLIESLRKALPKKIIFGPQMPFEDWKDPDWRHHLQCGQESVLDMQASMLA